MLNFEQGELVASITEVTERRGMVVGVLGIIRKINPEMGKYASRFATNRESLLVPDMFYSVNSAGETVSQLLRMALGGGEKSRYILKANHMIIAALLDPTTGEQEILRLVQSLNS